MACELATCVCLCIEIKGIFVITLLPVVYIIALLLLLLSLLVVDIC